MVTRIEKLAAAEAISEVLQKHRWSSIPDFPIWEMAEEALKAAENATIDQIDGPYEARNGCIYKKPVIEKIPGGGKTIEVGFIVAQMTNIGGAENAKIVAALMNAGHKSTTGPWKPLSDQSWMQVPPDLEAGSASMTTVLLARLPFRKEVVYGIGKFIRLGDLTTCEWNESGDPTHWAPFTKIQVPEECQHQESA